METLRGFISYSNEDRRRAAEVKTALAMLGVNSFMAHDDIDISEEWRERILEELGRMQVFVPLLSAAFKSSAWASQEVGFAISRPDVLIIPALLDHTIPYGFMAKWQGVLLPQPATSKFFLPAVASRFPRIALPHAIEQLEDARTFRHAESLMEPLVPFFDQLTAGEAARLAEIATDNGQIWDATLCRNEYLPNFLAKSAGKLGATAVARLRDRISQGNSIRAVDLS